VAQVQIQERIASLQKALRIACASPEAGRIQAQIDDAEQQLKLLQRQFALDQEDVFSRPVTETLGPNTRLDPERHQIQDLQSQIEQLKLQLAALPPPEHPQ
jgi:hypothetical protein